MKVSVITLRGSDWRLEVEVPEGTTVGELRQLLVKPPHSLALGADEKLLHRRGAGFVTAKPPEHVQKEVCLLKFFPPAEPEPEDGEPMAVRITTTRDGLEKWAVEVNVTRGTMIGALKDLLVGPPHFFPMPRSQRVLQRIAGTDGLLQGLRESDRVVQDVVLLDFDPFAGSTAGGSPKPGAPAAEAPSSAASQQSASRHQYWVDMRQRVALLSGLRDDFVRHKPRERRAYSFAHTVVFVREALDTVLVSGGSKPLLREDDGGYVVWILQATREVEGFLAKDGVFADARFSPKRPPLRCIVLGHDLDPYEWHSRGRAARVEMMSYRQVAGTAEAHGVTLPKPDLVLVYGAEFSGRAVPQHVLTAAGGARAALTVRFRPWEPGLQSLQKELGTRMLLDALRNPFSAQAGEDSADFDENGWVLGFADVPTLVEVLRGPHIRPPFPESRPPEDKLPATFWGIVDLKFDPRLPLFDAVKVLETGDGRNSRFSNHGADIPKRFRARYRLEDGAVARNTVVSNNKKLTHDELLLAGYGHLVPKQLCLPRVYHPGLAQRILKELECSEQDIVVLKLCNRSRAAGVIPVPGTELDEVLEELLEVPQADDLKAWFQRKLARGNAETLDVDWGGFEEQYRHWWSNECPVFVVERCCASIPMPMELGQHSDDGKLYDGTLRVAFAMRRRRRPSPPGSGEPMGMGAFLPASQHQQQPQLAPRPTEAKANDDANEKGELLEIEWLGGYWKLPKCDINSRSLRGRIVSAARTSGTAAVPPEQLHAIYTALGDSIQQLFGASEPSVRSLALRYGEEPELAAYLTARLAVSLRDLAWGRQVMAHAEEVLSRAQEGVARRYVHSYIERGYGIFEAWRPPGHYWQEAGTRFRQSVQHMPSNATSLYLLGISLLEVGETKEAVDFMQRGLLLDLDFKAPYIGLCIAFLRLGKLDAAIEISEALLRRHPESPQCHYHIALALYRKSAALEEKVHEELPLTVREQEVYEEYRKQAAKRFNDARESDEGQRMKAYYARAPWTDEDDKIYDLLRVSNSIFRGRKSAKTKAPGLSRNIGWNFYGWRN